MADLKFMVCQSDKKIKFKDPQSKNRRLDEKLDHDPLI